MTLSLFSEQYQQSLKELDQRQFELIDDQQFEQQIAEVILDNVESNNIDSLKELNRTCLPNWIRWQSNRKLWTRSW